jgi:small-conductance mechanosensitive channel/CRP-like cAMP-binding protein
LNLLWRASSWEWSWTLAAALLVILVRSLLPPDRRRRLLTPVVFLSLSVITLVPASLLGDTRPGWMLSVTSVFFLMLATLRLVFLVLFDTLPFTRGVPKILQEVLVGLGYFVALMAFFRANGVELSSILTTSALLTAVVGLALQDTLGNVISGLAIQMMRPYSVGDWVSFDGLPEHYGQVLEINWRATRIITNEQVTLLVPNANVAKGTVANFSQPSGVVRRTIRVSLSYDVPPARVEEVAVAAMAGTPEVVRDPPPDCLLVAFGDSGIDYACRFFIDDFRRREQIAAAVATRLYYAFRHAGIEIPYPIRTVHLHEKSDEQQRRDRDRHQQHLAERFQALDLLAPLGPDVLRELAARVHTRAYGRGQEIVREGDTGSDLYVVERGQVAVMVDVAGLPHEVARIGPGEFFGEKSFLTGESRRATIVALGDVEVVRVDHDSFREVLGHDPRVLEEMGRVLAMRQADLEALRSGKTDTGQTMETRSQVLIKKIRGFFGL